MPFADVHGKQIYYYSEVGFDSSKFNLVFVHGAGGSHKNWLSQIRHFSRGYNALALDLPGHGDSEGEGAESIAEYRDFVKAFLEALGLEKPVLVGHSMGGAITQSFALAYPELLKGIALVGTGAKLRVSPKILDALQGDPQAAVELICQWGYSPSAEPELLKKGKTELLKASIRVIERDFRACDAFDIMLEVKDIRVPTLLICGANDQLTPVKYTHFLHNHIQGSTLTIVPGASHFVMLEKPEEFNRALEAFLTETL